MRQDISFKGYQEGDIGRVTLAHALYYHEHWGFDLSFEAQVARELAEFLCRFKPEQDLFLAAWQGARFAGALAIDGADAAQAGVRLRWFITEPNARGLGLGRALLARALDFCRQAGHRQVYLWTFKGLEAARHLYEDAGFRLAQQHEVRQWGALIMEQRYDLALGGPA